MECYLDWGIADETSGIDHMMRRMSTQFMYGNVASEDDDYKYTPIEQTQRLMAYVLERRLKKYEKTNEYRNGSNQMYILLIELHYSHCIDSKLKNKVSINDKNKAPKVWRLVVCHADTNLDSLSDQIIIPAFGWRRHYHGYQFVAPGCGATFVPKKCDAIDMMHYTGYSWDSNKFDLRHVLRNPGDKVHYIYDLGDNWKHKITLIGCEDRGTKIDTKYFSKYNFVYEAMNKQNSDLKTLTLDKSSLIAGQINCPPEDSNGCDGMGNYYSILAKGKFYEPETLGVNWKEHGIINAYDFDIAEHQERFEEAMSKRKNPNDGCMRYYHPVAGDSNASRSFAL